MESKIESTTEIHKNKHVGPESSTLRETTAGTKAVSESGEKFSTPGDKKLMVHKTEGIGAYIRKYGKRFPRVSSYMGEIIARCHNLPELNSRESVIEEPKARRDANYRCVRAFLGWHV